ncbi:MAG TPA: hypothetical protein VEV15_08445 [Flavisolibacter sp.]|nr:hypothetical protein [Flavisolibacter sp.]
MEENFTPQQSLQLIQAMIVKTKAKLSQNSIYFLLWGWVSFVAILGQFFLKVVLHYKHHYLVWLITIPTVIASIVYTARTHKKHTVKTYVGESMSYVWTGIGISFFVLSIIITNTNGGWVNAWPFFILFYGLGTFISGKILQFTPLTVGGIFNWVLAVLCMYVNFDYQLLMAAAAILTSYIIPGHLLRSNNN